jgi:hypothetical protein
MPEAALLILVLILAWDFAQDQAIEFFNEGDARIRLRSLPPPRSFLRFRGGLSPPLLF